MEAFESQSGESGVEQSKANDIGGLGYVRIIAVSPNLKIIFWLLEIATRPDPLLAFGTSLSVTHPTPFLPLQNQVDFEFFRHGGT